MLSGRTLLHRQAAALVRAGARAIAVIGGWRAEALATSGYRVFREVDWAETSMFSSLMVADEWLREEECLICYGDIIFESTDASRLASLRHDLAIAYDPAWIDMWRQRFGDPLDDAEVFRHTDDGRLVEAGGRAPSLADADGQYLGLLRLTPRGWTEAVRVAAAAARDGDPVRDITDVLTRVVSAGRLEVRTMPISGVWWEFDHPRDIGLGLPVVHRIDERERLRQND